MLRTADGGRVEPLRVTIITATLDCEGVLEGALQSVGRQEPPPLEHLIVDGGSRDGTAMLVRRAAESSRYPILWSSEPDGGIAEAFNKGLRLARGDVVAILGADDRYEGGAIAAALAALRPDDAFVFGDAVYVGERGARHGYAGDAHYRRSIRYRMPSVPHPSLFVRRTAYERLGGFDTSLRLAMDYEWLLRAHRAGLRGRRAQGLRVELGLGGVSDRRFVRALWECRGISVRHGFPAPLALGYFGYAATRGLLRRAAERLLPRGAALRLRRLANPLIGAS